MKVLVTASTFPRWPNDSVPDFILQQVLALKKVYPDLDLHVLVPHHRGAAKREEFAGIHIYRFSYLYPYSLQQLVYPAIMPNIRVKPLLLFQVPFFIIAQLLAIKRLCQEIKPDVLYSHWFAPQALSSYAVAKLLHVPHVFTSHSSDVQIMSKLPVVGPYLVRRIAGDMHAITVVSRRSLEKLKTFFDAAQWRGLADRVRIIPMGVDLAHLQAEPDREEYERLLTDYDLHEKRIILFIGRLSQKKGIEFLVEAFARIVPEHPDLVLVIAGAGEWEVKVRKKIGQFSLRERVVLTGYLTGARKHACLHAAKILAVPSIITADGDAEGLPVSLMEGLAAGKLCVATDTSGADDVILDGETGFLVEEKNVEQLSGALMKAIHLPPEPARRMAEQARRRAQDFDWPSIARRHYEHLFLDLSLPHNGVIQAQSPSSPEQE